MPLPAHALPPLPPQDPNVPWPTQEWPSGSAIPEIDAIVDCAFSEPDLEETLAVLVVQNGRVIAEKYGPTADADTTLVSWSMAKSMIQAGVGILVRDAQMTLDDPAGFPEWQTPGDGRAGITIRDLLTMRSGLLWNEDYIDGDTSHVLEMLLGAGMPDMPAFVAALPQEHAVDTVFNYSSGTTNLVSKLLSDVVGTGEDGIGRWIERELFGPIGMRSAEPRFDGSGTWVGSSYLYATARDFAKFGHLYLRDGAWAGERILPAGWVDLARTPLSFDDESGQGYGHHWWTVPDAHGSFACSGYEGQRIQVVPAADAVFVRLGKTPAERSDALQAFYAQLSSALVTAA